MIKSSKYAGFQVTLATGSKSKKLLSNKLTLRIPSERSELEVHLTLREAHALNKFLTDNLGDNA